LWRSNGSTGMSASVGTDRDFLWGFMLGFFVGFLMLVWVWMPTVPHKQKLGILTGICLQLALGMLKNAEHGDDDFVD
jgi:xanthine/uracil/vitamin C permease (AzgA family)